MTGGEKVCPRCGARFGEDARFECPFCGEPVTPDTTECPACHITYNDFVSEAEHRAREDKVDTLLEEIIEHESRQVKEQGNSLSCPRCSWMVSGSEDRCPKCGISFGDEVAYQCPVCAALVTVDAARCEECGAVFSKERAEEPAEMTEIEIPAAEETPAETPAPEPEVVEMPHEEPPAEPEAPTTVVEAVQEVDKAAPETPEPAEQEKAESPRDSVPKRKVKRRKLKAKPKN